MTEERRNHLREVNLGKTKPYKKQTKIKCPYCNKEGGSSNIKRYHYDNCKNKDKKDE